MVYSLDTSVLINGWHKNYPPDIFPMFWKNLSNLIDEGSVIASCEVLSELKKQRDDLLSWCVSRKHMFFDVDEATQLAVREILQHYARLIESRPAVSNADVWVIALAKVKGAPVVTEEHPANNLRRPKIPDVCKDMGVQCLNTVELMREQRWKFG